MIKTRRDFIKLAASAGLISSIPSIAFPNNNSYLAKDPKLIWANLLHLGSNMWEDHPYIKADNWPVREDEIYKDDYVSKTPVEAAAWALRGFRSSLVFDETVWNTVLKQMADSGMNMVIIDLGDGIKYDSHPEIAVKNAWSVDKLRKELVKIRKLGLEPIPKLNFATTHDAWLGEYSRMVSTEKYYSVCRDLISEVIEIFDTPRYFHLGMDEETAPHQVTFNYSVVRQRDLWWKDLFFYINEVEKKGVRSWVWSDYGWHHPESFFKNMPKSVLQSNWYYESIFDLAKIDAFEKVHLEFYDKLEAAGYDQVPTGSNWSTDVNMEGTVAYSKKHINPDRLLGFMTAPWFPTLPICQEKLLQAVKQVERAKKTYY